MPFLKRGFTSNCQYQWQWCSCCCHQDVCCQGAFSPAFLNWDFGVALCQNSLAKWQDSECHDSLRNCLWDVADQRALFGLQVYGDSRWVGRWTACHVVRLQHGYCTVTQAGQFTSHRLVLKNCQMSRCISLVQITTLGMHWRLVAASDHCTIVEGWGKLNLRFSLYMPWRHMGGGKVSSIHYSPCS